MNWLKGRQADAPPCPGPAHAGPAYIYMCVCWGGGGEGGWWAPAGRPALPESRRARPGDLGACSVFSLPERFQSPTTPPTPSPGRTCRSARAHLRRRPRPDGRHSGPPSPCFFSPRSGDRDPCRPASQSWLKHPSHEPPLQWREQRGRGSLALPGRRCLSAARPGGPPARGPEAPARPGSPGRGPPTASASWCLQ